MAADKAAGKAANRLVCVGNKIAAAQLQLESCSNPLSTNRTNVQAGLMPAAVLLLLAGTVQGINVGFDHRIDAITQASFQ